MAYLPVQIDRHGNGNIGRFAWVNSDTRRTASSWTFWGDWWWDTANEWRRPVQDENITPHGDSDD